MSKIPSDTLALKELRNRFGTLKRSISYSKESEIMALGSNDSKVRVYTIPNIKNMSRINTLIGCKGPIKGCWVGGETGLDVIAVDQIGMVCMWQQDYQRTELEFSLDVSFLTSQKLIFVENEHRKSGQKLLEP